MAHTYTNLLIHALFSTKDRRPILDAEFRHELFAYMGGIIKGMNGRPVLINGPSDHVHLLFILPAALPLADFMETLKSNSSKWVKENWGRRGFAWQTGYTGFSVSQSKLEDVKAYIGNQEAHHKKLTYQEEVLSLLKHHGIEFDPRYVF